MWPLQASHRTSPQSLGSYRITPCLPPVALGSLVAGVRKRLNNCQRDTAPLSERLPLPAPVALATQELGERLLMRAKWTPHDPDMPLLRVAVATVTAYIFFNRGECSACANAEDVVVNNTNIALVLRHETKTETYPLQKGVLKDIISLGGCNIPVV